MMRRTAVYAKPDRWVVKLLLIAAAFALTAGFFAQHRLATRTADTTVVAEQQAEPRPADAARGAS